MKTRYKITLVIAIFVLFYVTVPLFTQHCLAISDDCDLFRQLMNQTRAGIVVSSKDSGIGGWSGTAQEMHEPTIIEQLRANIPFIQTMVVPPIAIIAVIVL